MPDFIDELPLTPEQKQQIRAMGVDSPIALYAAVKATTETFFNFLGVIETVKLSLDLEKMLGPEEVENFKKLEARLNRDPLPPLGVPVKY